MLLFPSTRKLLLVYTIFCAENSSRRIFLHPKNDAPPHLLRCGLIGARFFDLKPE